jgi:hypothetical protein
MAERQSGGSRTREKGLGRVRGKPPISIAEIARRLIMSEKASLPYETSVRLAVVLALVMPCAGSKSFEIVNVDDASARREQKQGWVSMSRHVHHSGGGRNSMMSSRGGAGLRQGSEARPSLRLNLYLSVCLHSSSA